MAKRMFAGCAIGLALCLSELAMATTVPVQRDGCAELGRLVYAEVSAAVLYGPGKSGPWVIDQGNGEIRACEHTAKTVSKAFTLAMNNAGYSVSWGVAGPRPTTRNGDYCWSGILSQCYPGRSDGMNTQYGSALVQKSWMAVSNAVMRQMHNPYSSDEIRFRDNDLKLRLGLTLRMAASDRTIERR